jgi:3-oxoacyl-(acyl-carrier-protein) synthase III
MGLRDADDDDKSVLRVVGVLYRDAALTHVVPSTERQHFNRVLDYKPQSLQKVKRAASIYSGKESNMTERSPITRIVVAIMVLLTLPTTSQAFSIQPIIQSSSTRSSAASSSLSSSTRLCVTSQGGPMACRPIGIGSAVPTTRLTNAALESVVETSDEWIQTRTGIAARRVLVQMDAVENGDGAVGDTATTASTKSQSLRDLSVAAAQAALTMAKVEAKDIDVVICCTSSPDDLFGDAPTIASQLGCTTNTVAFDLTAACSGFLFGMVTAGTFLSSPSSSTQRALVIGADALSRWVDWDDRNACILFGDGAGAMVLERCGSGNDDDEASATPGILGYAAHSNGMGHNELNLEYVFVWYFVCECVSSCFAFLGALSCVSRSPPSH